MRLIPREGECVRNYRIARAGMEVPMTVFTHYTVQVANQMK